jgi:uncharacterized protein (DUF697 family)/predicted GTPase
MVEPGQSDGAAKSTAEPVVPQAATPGEPTATSWQVRLSEIWQGTTQWLQQVVPSSQAGQTLQQWFKVSDEQVAEILVKVKAELPTTEALLIGKPQAGKSSIVRGLTGVSAEIVGQGFRPHTQHTQRYCYPSRDLPLLIFTDTVGLGDVYPPTTDLVAELERDLQAEQRARVLIWTVKINDFAIDRLRQIAQSLRQAYPAIPCLLAVTCLHEVYPVERTQHLPYPPEDPQVQAAFAALQADFTGLYDQAILLDFTLEEDGYSPVFYGLEALRDALAALLPKAESRAIRQLLEQRQDLGDRLGQLYREVGRHYILAFTVMAAAVEAMPIPFASMPVLTALQISMVTLLGKLYGQVLTPAQAGAIVSTLAGGFLAQAVGRELIKFIPGFGSVIAASWAAAYTWALGEGACVYFGDLMGGKKPDSQRIQGVMQVAFKTARQRFMESNTPDP